MPDQPQILLRPGANGKSKPFAADHAERLLAYPNTQWQRVEDDDVPKPKAAADKKKPAAAAPVSPEVDTTGHPTSI